MSMDAAALVRTIRGTKPQTVFAAEIYLTQQSVSHLENGKAQPSLATLMYMAHTQQVKIVINPNGSLSLVKEEAPNVWDAAPLVSPPHAMD